MSEEVSVESAEGQIRNAKRLLEDDSEAHTSKVLKVTSETPVILNRANWLKKLQCPVCLETPGSGPLFGCRNGHIHCTPCVNKVKQCAICRCTDLKCRQLLGESALLAVTENLEMTCRHTHCSVKGTFRSVSEHEYLCMARQIHCPLYFRGTCTFQGHMRSFLQHIRDVKCCQLIVFPGWKRDSPNEAFEKDTVFENQVRDFPSNQSVFLQNNSVTHWKPTLFVSKKVVSAGLACLYVIRYPDKTWRIYVRTFIAPEKAKYWKISLEVSDFSNKNSPVYSYLGTPVSNTITRDFSTPNKLVLHDDQIKPLKRKDTNKLFDYRLKVFLDPHFEIECNNLANGVVTLREHTEDIVASGPDITYNSPL